jgi:DNA-directed RNA polymerase specialized sigma24 family protein
MPTTIAPRFNQLVEQHYQPLFRFAVSLCGRPETALELTQRTFHRALEGNGSLPARSNVKQWLFTILFLEFLEIRPRAGAVHREANFS